MPKKMTKWGVGPKFLIYSVIYSIFIIAVTKDFYPLFKITIIPYYVLATIAAVLILIGIPFYIISFRAVMPAFKAGQLVTSGIYGICRHPIYASWIVFFVPAFVLLANTWIGFSIPVVMYFILQILVKEEDQYLEKKFGEQYLAYRKKVPAVLPIGWLR